MFQNICEHNTYAQYIELQLSFNIDTDLHVSCYSDRKSMSSDLSKPPIIPAGVDSSARYVNCVVSSLPLW
jgi:hypothetical protein